MSNAILYFFNSENSGTAMILAFLCFSARLISIPICLFFLVGNSDNAEFLQKTKIFFFSLSLKQKIFFCIFLLFFVLAQSRICKQWAKYAGKLFD